MFNFGWGELVVIGIVALIAIGPKELPTVLRAIGQWTGKVRRMASEFQGQFQDALREAELHDLPKHAEDLTSDVKNFASVDPLADVQKDIESATADLGSIPSDNTPVATPGEPATAMEASNPLPDIDAPPAELAPPPGENEFSSTEPSPAKAKPARAKKPAKKSAEVEEQSGDGA